ncbi:MAG TPA: BPTI/Kunitz domain-containing protein [Polyangiaceae bacterium]|nr:BPTI/Kunitz domain-containing protein [Polyangiaceae bacterium]
MALVTSCGGKTEDPSGTGGASTSGGSAGRGAGGRGGTSSATGGSSGVGGDGVGGTFIGVSGQAGSGGFQERCTLPQDPGPCVAAFPAYFHDAATGLCLPFTYGGCGGNTNRFESIQDCQASCRGGTSDLDACETPTDCTLVPVACCGGCGNEELDSVVAIHRNRERAYATLRGCTGIACAPCQEIDPLERTDRYFVPTCQNGQCRVIDLRTDLATICSRDDDCRLRNGIGCCEGCSADPGQLVAIHREQEGNFSRLVCGTGPVACPACAPIPPDGYAAVCSRRRCTVVGATPR